MTWRNGAPSLAPGGGVGEGSEPIASGLRLPSASLGCRPAGSMDARARAAIAHVLHAAAVCQ